MTITLFTLRGIGEQIGKPGMCTAVTRRLDPRLYEVVEIAHPASYGPVPLPLGPSYDDTIRVGRQMLLDAIDRTPNPAAILGYSGGAGIAGHVAREIALGMHPHLEVAGVALISDPFMPVSASPVRGTWGVAGNRSIPSRFPVYWAADPADAICCCPGDSPLRTVSDQTASASVSDPVAWGRDLEDRLRRGRWQPSAIDWRNPLGTFRRYQRALHDLDGYLRRGDHVEYSIRTKPGASLTYTDWLASELNALGRKYG